MCGIVAVFGPRQIELREIAERLLGRIAHRGESGLQRELASGAGWMLGANRLAITTGPLDRQPARSVDGSITLVLNGEIFNHKFLCRTILGGNRPDGQPGDTNVLADLVSSKGLDIIPLLDGMFGALFVDHRQGRAYAYRDRLGIKPLYYSEMGEFLLVASEIKALAPENEIREIKEVFPGTTITIGFGSGDCGRVLGEEPYFVLRQGSAGRVDSDELRSALDDSMRDQCDYPLPIGVYLSGGVDSSGVYALAKRYAQSVVPLILSRPGASDAVVARRLVDELGDTPVIGDCPNEGQLFAGISDVIRVTESFEPNVVRQSSIQKFIAQLAIEADLKVILCGEGADELFCGYPDFRAQGVDWIALRLAFLRDLRRTQLQRVDRASMAVTTEVRVPYLCNRVLDLALASSDRSSFVEMARDGFVRDKSCLRAALNDALPDWVRLRSKVVLSEGLGLPGNHPTKGLFRVLADAEVSTARFREVREAFPEWSLNSPEEVYYFEIFHGFGYSKARFMANRVTANVIHSGSHLSEALSAGEPA